MTPFPRTFTAQGIRNCGFSARGKIHFGTKITHGNKDVIGRDVDVHLDEYDLAFMLECLAERYPNIFRMVSGELGDYEPPDTIKYPNPELEERLRTVIYMAIETQENPQFDG